MILIIVGLNVSFQNSLHNVKCFLMSNSFFNLFGLFPFCPSSSWTRIVKKNRQFVCLQQMRLEDLFNVVFCHIWFYFHFAIASLECIQDACEIHASNQKRVIVRTV